MIHFWFKCNFLFIQHLLLEKKVIFINNLLFHTSLHYYPKSSISELSLPLSSGGSSLSSIRASWRGTAPLQYKVSIKTMLSIFTHRHIIMLPFIIKPPWIKLLWSILYTAFLSPCSKNHFPMMLTVDERWPDLCNCCQVKKKQLPPSHFIWITGTTWFIVRLVWSTILISISFHNDRVILDLIYGVIYTKRGSCCIKTCNVDITILTATKMLNKKNISSCIIKSQVSCIEINSE